MVEIGLNESSRDLSLDDFQAIVGSALNDVKFRSALSINAKAALEKLKIKGDLKEDNPKSLAPVESLACAMKKGLADATLQDAFADMKACYLDPADGIKRSRCI